MLILMLMSVTGCSFTLNDGAAKLILPNLSKKVKTKDKKRTFQDHCFWVVYLTALVVSFEPSFDRRIAVTDPCHARSHTDDVMLSLPWSVKEKTFPSSHFDEFFCV